MTRNKQTGKNATGVQLPLKIKFCIPKPVNKTNLIDNGLLALTLSRTATHHLSGHKELPDIAERQDGEVCYI